VLGALVAIGALIGIVALVMPDEGSAHDREARAAARSFIARYVQENGRVVRADQGGDTVSEGQSYGLLLAQVAGDHDAFERIWKWTSGHLLRRDGLLAYHANSRRVISNTPATDADLVTAWALLRADGPDSGSYQAAGMQMANAVTAHEAVARREGSVLAAGPWGTGNPMTVNPSYFAMPAIEALAKQNSRWQSVGRAALAVTSAVTARGRQLPPDWVRVDGDNASATPPSDHSVPDIRYSLDAQRLPVWLAASCNPQARKLAGGWWPLVSKPSKSGAIALDQRGNVRNGGQEPLAFVAAAASASAAGRPADRDRLLDQATASDAAHPSYYGGAWVALGRALLTTRSLGGCADLGGQ
jgi:endoglucanase